MAHFTQKGTQRGFLYEVLEALLAVERDDRDALEIPRVQRVIGRDVDLLKWRADALEDDSRIVAEVTAGLAVEDELHASARSPEA
jgi:hypothetical protein